MHTLHITQTHTRHTHTYIHTYIHTPHTHITSKYTLESFFKRGNSAGCVAALHTHGRKRSKREGVVVHGKCTPKRLLSLAVLFQPEIAHGLVVMQPLSGRREARGNNDRKHTSGCLLMLHSSPCTHSTPTQHIPRTHTHTSFLLSGHVLEPPYPCADSNLCGLLKHIEGSTELSTKVPEVKHNQLVSRKPA